ncbi:hypothetical protein GGQ68_000694 [Sagittula marina]|uniref:Uncharacterized protein n=1 Tax=Sagittula marina TaxID=943940 RepID=A0A7W6GRA0_9RHOB|nr:hypothetical protein [Sagittula marina]MBB3984378.1 hypothetical protein [Sagittula marina]
MSGAATTETLLQRLAHAQVVLAGLVVEDTAFLPFFERVEQEIEMLRSKSQALERARKLAAG